MFKKKFQRDGEGMRLYFSKEDVRLWKLTDKDIAFVKLDKEIDWNELKERVKRFDDKLKVEGKS